MTSLTGVNVIQVYTQTKFYEGKITKPVHYFSTTKVRLLIHIFNFRNTKALLQLSFISLLESILKRSLL